MDPMKTTRLQALRFFVNPLDLKWSGTVALQLFKTKDTRETRQAIAPVLVVRDTPEARKALGFRP